MGSGKWEVGAVWVCLILPLVLLAGCSSAPPKKEAARIEPVRPAVSAPATVATPKAPIQKKGGAYYQDDGPGDNPPDLAAVPEPVPRREPLRRAANKPYSVLGQDFQPFEGLRKYSTTGIGSWYGRKFHGQQTSSGERYDMYGMTAAHPILPIPSYARVTNLKNGKSVVVRVNDRGPFLNGRLIDLSYAAAWKLGYAEQGSAPLRVEAIIPGELPVMAAAPEATPPAAPFPLPPAPGADEDDPIAAFAREDEAPVAVPAVAGKGGIFLQLASFSSRGNAESFRERFSTELPDAGAPLSVVPGSGLFRIHLGPYADAREATRAADRLGKQLHIKPFVVR
ncbi:MAG: septal ring lytic transglycosylase RlpA family protein [Rhodocyclaceae bacterium]|nr:septal ring lytic transglycosylase RlpA family protein [Rhodocyclaceae bacterium]